MVVFMAFVTRNGHGLATCRVGTAVLHYLLLAVLCCMLAQGYHLYRTFVELFDAHLFPWRRFVVLLVLGPGVIACLTAGLGWKDYGTERYCWLPRADGLRWAYLGPLLAVTAINLYFFLVAIVNISSLHGRTERRLQV